MHSCREILDDLNFLGDAMTKSGGLERKHKHKEQWKKSFFSKTLFLFNFIFLLNFRILNMNLSQASLRLPEKIIDRKFAYYALAKVLYFNFIF